MLARAREVYQKTKKPVDNSWTYYVSRPPAALVVALLERSPITPNQVTLLSFLVGMLSAAILALLPGHPSLIAGVLVFQLAYILDCVDGMLARVRGISSPQGHLLDFLMDELKALAFFGAVALRLYSASADTRFLILGVLGLIALASGLSLTTFTRRPELAPPPPTAPTAEAGAAAPDRPAPAKRRSPLALVEGLARFLIHYPSYIVYLAIFDRIDLYFYAYLGVNMLYYAKTLLSVALKMGRR